MEPCVVTLTLADFAAGQYSEALLDDRPRVASRDNSHVRRREPDNVAFGPGQGQSQGVEKVRESLLGRIPDVLERRTKPDFVVDGRTDEWYLEEEKPSFADERCGDLNRALDVLGVLENGERGNDVERVGVVSEQFWIVDIRSEHLDSVDAASIGHLRIHFDAETFVVWHELAQEMPVS